MIRRRIGDAGRKSEARIAKKIGARPQLNSGACAGSKGDMTHPGLEHKFLIEAKSTQHGTMGVNLDWLNKIAIEAMEKNSVPALTVTFTDSEGRSRRNGEWAMLPLWLVRELFLS